ncbi:MAG: hypothetical protein K0R38_2387 [Polyangiaceae bacterium]|nr:hypothetical protein [Polyangiaceae bacterium]
MLLTSGACSLMAPSDAELLGKMTRPTSSNAGSDGSGESNGGAVTKGGANSGSSGSLGGAGETELPPLGGDGSLPGAGGERGNSDFSSLIPQDGLALWLMADHGIGEVEGGAVAVWSDFSVNESDAKQSLGSLQPKLVPNARGSLPLLEFDGVDDRLSLPSGFADFSAGLSVFIIASQSSDQGCPSLLQLSNEPEAQDVEVGRFHGAVHYEVAEDDVWGEDDSFALQQLVLVGVTHAPGKNPELQLNAMHMETGTFTALPEVKERTNNFIGRSLYQGCEPFHGRIGEIILYSRALDTTERLAVHLYLQNKWSYEPPVKTKPGPGEIPAAN